MVNKARGVIGFLKPCLKTVHFIIPTNS